MKSFRKFLMESNNENIRDAVLKIERANTSNDIIDAYNNLKEVGGYNIFTDQRIPWSNYENILDVLCSNYRTPSDIIISILKNSNKGIYGFQDLVALKTMKDPKVLDAIYKECETKIKNVPDYKIVSILKDLLRNPSMKSYQDRINDALSKLGIKQ